MLLTAMQMMENVESNAININYFIVRERESTVICMLNWFVQLYTSIDIERSPVGKLAQTDNTQALFTRTGTKVECEVILTGRA